MDEWATAYASEFKVPVDARAWATLLRALQALGWAALAECKKVWKVFCKLRAGESAEVAATAKQVAGRRGNSAVAKRSYSVRARVHRRGQRQQRIKIGPDGSERS